MTIEVAIAAVGLGRRLRADPRVVAIFVAFEIAHDIIANILPLPLTVAAAARGLSGLYCVVRRLGELRLSVQVTSAFALAGTFVPVPTTNVTEFEAARARHMVAARRPLNNRLTTGAALPALLLGQLENGVVVRTRLGLAYRREPANRVTSACLHTTSLIIPNPLVASCVREYTAFLDASIPLRVS